MKQEPAFWEVLVGLLAVVLQALVYVLACLYEPKKKIKKRPFFKLEVRGEAMQCKNCPNLVWFGDYNLHYCDITKEVVEPEWECELNEC